TETSQAKQAILLGWKSVPARMGPAIVYPYHRADGSNGYSRIKPDHPRTVNKKPVKYESPKGQPNEVYIPAGTFAALENPLAELFVTEGEKKSLAADQAGFPCIGLVGVYGWKEGKHERLIPPLARIAWKGRKVFIAFDSDLADKPEVQDAENRLAYHLGQLGAVVRCLRIPAGTPDVDGKPTKQGIDDFLVAHGKDGLFALVKEAIEPAEVSSVEMRANASELDPASEVAAYLKSGERDGASRLRSWRGTFWLWRNGYYQELPTSEVRSHFVNHVNRGFSKVTTGIVANCLMQLHAQTLLGSHVEAPSWISDREPPFSAAETLVCRNGILHLPSYIDGVDGHFKPLTPRLFSTCGLDFNFEPDAPTPEEWRQFLEAQWANDPDSTDTLREWFGYSLLPDTSQHKILLLVGPPRSGKGTIARVLRQLVGVRNVAAPTLASLGTNFGLQSLIGKSLAIIADARLGGRADIAATTERLLSISGEDAQTIDRKNIEPVTCKLPTRFVILTNELPRLSDTSGALANRMVILRTTESFLGREDQGLFDRLAKELPGILLWSIVGWDRLRRRGRFAEPDTSADMRAEFSDLTSPIGAFVRECCLVGPQHECARDDLYATYQGWCKQAGRQHVEDKAGFGRALHAALPQLKTVNRRADEGRERRYAGLAAKAGLGF
ncbi:MAG TPA: phage/plasmid primase, P4 family, partial [Pirellulales bacterium]|nr:phage/plasmid primase, P4 family [Pirellulales bacterium]